MSKYIPAAIMVLLLSGYSALTYARVPVWENALTLNRAGVKVSPNSCRANCFYATALFREYQKEKDLNKQKEILDEAGKYIRKSIAINPAYHSAYMMYGGILTEEFKFDKNLQKLMDGFYQILSSRDNMQYVDQYLAYMNGKPEYREGLLAFYHRIAMDNFLPQQKFDLAIKYLNFGLGLDPGNAVLNADRDKLRQLSGR